MFLRCVLVLTVYAVLAALVVSQSSAGSEDRAAEARSPLNRELIEAIFQQLSAPCRAQMEAAMEIAASDAEGGSSPTPAEMSPECRKELEESAKRVAASRGHSAKASSGSSSSTGEGASAASQQGETDSSDATNNSAQSTIVLVVSLLALFGAVVGYIIYINANMSQGGTKKSMRKKDKKMK